MNNPLGLKFLLRISFRLSHLKKCSFSHNFENEINPHFNQQLFFFLHCHHFSAIQIVLNSRKALDKDLLKFS